MKEVVEEYGLVAVYCITLMILMKAIPVLMNVFEAVNMMFLLAT